MQPTFSQMFKPEELEMSTEAEKKIFAMCNKEFEGFVAGKIDGIKIRQEISYCAVLAKRQQSRSAMAMIKHDMEKRALGMPLQIESK